MSFTYTPPLTSVVLVGDLRTVANSVASKATFYQLEIVTVAPLANTPTSSIAPASSVQLSSITGELTLANVGQQGQFSVTIKSTDTRLGLSVQRAFNITDGLFAWIV